MDKTKRIEELETVCAEAYQVVGSIAHMLPNEKVLDNLAACKLVHKDVLPFTLTEDAPADASGMTSSGFKESVYELAFGDDAINKDYTMEQVIEQLTKQVQELSNFVATQEEALSGDDEEDMTEENFEYYERVIEEVKEFRNNG